MAYNKDEFYNKKIDLEQKKKKLAEKFGAQFNHSNDLPPEIESDWLGYIEEFEEQFNGAQKITVWEYIGKPDFKKLDEMNDAEIAAEYLKPDTVLR